MNRITQENYGRIEDWMKLPDIEELFRVPGSRKRPVHFQSEPWPHSDNVRYWSHGNIAIAVIFNDETGLVDAFSLVNKKDHQNGTAIQESISKW